MNTKDREKHRKLRENKKKMLDKRSKLDEEISSIDEQIDDLEKAELWRLYKNTKLTIAQYQRKIEGELNNDKNN